MYSVDKDKKTLKKLDECNFTSLGVKERRDIEEWIAKDTQILGEKLLIIQKEFNGFDKTNERPDLLGLDKEGNIVVIELKRDDSGKDANWQAIKYASYCSTLTTENIIDMYSSYLEDIKDISIPDKDIASGEIAKFLNTSVEDLNLNSKQRIILVATKYRKEVLATAMWLLDNDIDIKCVSIQPYKDEKTSSFYIVPTIILPPPNTEDYRIKRTAVRKEQEETIKSRGYNYFFFERLNVLFNKCMQKEMPFSRTRGKTYKIRTPFPLETAHFEFYYTDNSLSFGVGLHFESSKEENKKLAEAVKEKASNWESIQGINYDSKWRWGISFHVEWKCSDYDEEELLELAVEKMKELYDCFNPALEAVHSEMNIK